MLNVFQCMYLAGCSPVLGFIPTSTAITLSILYPCVAFLFFLGLSQHRKAFTGANLLGFLLLQVLPFPHFWPSLRICPLSRLVVARLVVFRLVVIGVISLDGCHIGSGMSLSQNYPSWLLSLLAGC